jgi:hypothetical protein
MLNPMIHNPQRKLLRGPSAHILVTKPTLTNHGVMW